MKVYKHILFDLDQTLWDFESNCSETLSELYETYNLSKITSVSCHNFIDAYKYVNKIMWKDYNRGLVTKEILRSKRFDITFDNLGISAGHITAQMNADFLKTCPTKSTLVPYAVDLLNYLQDKYSLHIATNGFKESQVLKLKNSQIDFYFKNMINSDCSGYLKPDKRFFDHVLHVIKAKKEDCVMIGDDFEADIKGAENAGIDSIYFNPESNTSEGKVRNEIKCLSELINIL